METKQTGGDYKPFYYYPGYGLITKKAVRTRKDGSTVEYDKIVHKNYPRKVLAGVVSGKQIFVGESQAFGGHPGRDVYVNSEGLIIHEPKQGFTWSHWEDAKVADPFVKKRGKEIAEARAWKAVHAPTEEARIKAAAFIIDIPSGEVNTGKLFVAEVEKRYPKHMGTFKPRKKKSIKVEEPVTETPAVAQ